MCKREQAFWEVTCDASNLVSPGQMYILKTVVSSVAADPYSVLFYLRLATCNQICDPWIYILCQESSLRRVKLPIRLMGNSDCNLN